MPDRYFPQYLFVCGLTSHGQVKIKIASFPPRFTLSQVLHSYVLLKEQLEPFVKCFFLRHGYFHITVTAILYFPISLYFYKIILCSQRCYNLSHFLARITILFSTIDYCVRVISNVLLSLIHIIKQLIHLMRLR